MLPCFLFSLCLVPILKVPTQNILKEQQSPFCYGLLHSTIALYLHNKLHRL